MRRKELLKRMSEIEGASIDELLQNATFDSIAVGICSKCGEYTTEVEPDCRECWCELCETNTVVSCLVLANLI